jgi:hypothetical protein
MTYVKATNYKLIDRVARNVQFLRPELAFPDIVHAIFRVRPTLSATEPIVLKVIDSLINNK